MDKAFKLDNSHQSPEAVAADMIGSDHQHCWHGVGLLTATTRCLKGDYVCCHCGEKYSGYEDLLPIHSHGPFKPAPDADIPATPDPSTQ